MNTNETIKSFLTLPKGWHYGSGIPMSEITTNIALEFNEYAENFGLITEAFPGVDGEILLSIYGWEENSLEITIFFSDISYRLEQNDEVVEEEEFASVEDVYSYINVLGNTEIEYVR